MRACVTTSSTAITQTNAGFISTKLINTPIAGDSAEPKKETD